MGNRRLVLTACASLLIATTCECENTDGCGLRFQLESRFTGLSMAELTLRRLPGGHEDVVSLAFSPEAQQTLGLGPNYPGSFDASFRALVVDAACGLTSSGGGESYALIVDEDPPSSSLFDADEFVIGADYSYGSDYVALINADTDEEIRIRGGWVAVPEPSGLACLLLPVLAWLRKRRVMRTRIHGAPGRAV